MTDPPPGARSDDSGSRPGRQSTTGAPRWVKVFGIIVIVLVVLFAILQLTGWVEAHGPGRRLSLSSLDGTPLHSPVAESGDGSAGHRTLLAGWGAL
jgi:hypothetical protein